jgi:hypothetical protein
MPQKRQAKRPDAVALPHVHTESYPSAPTEPKARLDWMRRRAARIAGIDEAEYMDAMAGQDRNTREFIKQGRGLKPPLSR